jgi:hypothetical protein
MTHDDLENLFEAFGGMKAMSDITGIPYTTIHSWKLKSAIPSHRVYQLRTVAGQNSIILPSAFRADTQAA